MDKEKTLNILEAIQNSYAGFKVDKKKVDFWYYAMHKMDYELVQKKLMKHILEEKFPPTISEIAAYRKQPDQALIKIEAYEKEASKQGEIPQHLKDKMQIEIEKITRKFVK